MSMNLRKILTAVLGAILAVFGLAFVIQHMGWNTDFLVGIVSLVIGIWILLGLPISL